MRGTLPNIVCYQLFQVIANKYVIIPCLAFINVHFFAKNRTDVYENKHAPECNMIPSKKPLFNCFRPLCLSNLSKSNLNKSDHLIETHLQLHPPKKNYTLNWTCHSFIIWSLLSFEIDLPNLLVTFLQYNLSLPVNWSIIHSGPQEKRRFRNNQKLQTTH